VKPLVRFVLATLLVLAASAKPASASDFQVIVNPANPIDSMTREQVERVFLKKIAKWDNGAVINVVDQQQTSAARLSFTKAIHKKAVSAVTSYWRQQIFAGRAVPPAEMSSDALIVAFVAANPGAIGYISGGAAADGVKVLIVR
jgi:ABC-type phosphate transport system substrate-binding protein